MDVPSLFALRMETYSVRSCPKSSDQTRGEWPVRLIPFFSPLPSFPSSAYYGILWYFFFLFPFAFYRTSCLDFPSFFFH